MSDFIFSVNQYLGPKDQLNPFSTTNSLANPEKINFDRAIADLVCRDDYWATNAMRSAPASKPRSIFSLANLFSGFATAGPAVKNDAAPIFRNAKMIVSMDGVSCYADDFNGNDMRDLKSKTAKEIASRMRMKLISTIEPVARSSGASSTWNVSEVTKNGRNIEMTARVPEIILNQLRQSFQSHATLT